MKELDQLADIRLDRDLSYKALSEEVGLSERTIWRLLEQPEASQPTKRTLFKIRKYLDAQKEQPEQKRPVAQKARATA